MSGFSSSVMLGDLNDFISPSQACVNPIFAKPKEKEDEKQTAGMPKIGLAIENDLGFGWAAEKVPVQSFQAPPDLIKKTENQTAKVSLSDCLACSGCITSAETVLIEQQSTSEFKRSIASGKYDVIVVTISAQSRSSLAVQLGLDSNEAAHQAIDNFLRSKLNVDFCLDASVAGDVALLETANEFLSRYRASQSGETGSPGWKCPPYSSAISSTESQLNPNQENSQSVVHNGFVPDTSAMPMITSACPGWICFAEKSNPEVIPFISSAKSPQQIAGAIVKRFVSVLTGTDPGKIYHATVMPCADKKLEASRKDFLDAETQTNDVDCVLTTIELAELMSTDETVDMEVEGVVELTQKKSPHEWNQIMSDLANASLDGGALVGVTAGGDGAGSGGYLEYVFRVAAKQLFNVDVGPGPLPYKVGRNGDMRTVELHVEGKPVLRFAAAYGFRNIQSIMRQMKRGKSQYDFLEIMACPGGCLNGGGQVRPPKKAQGSDPLLEMEESLTNAAAGRERLAQVSTLFHARKARLPEHNAAATRLYEAWVHGNPYSENARKIFHTRYHAVPKLQNGLLERW